MPEGQGLSVETTLFRPPIASYYSENIWGHEH